MKFRQVSLVLGLLFLLAPVVFPKPPAMTHAAWLASGLALAMAFWWLTEALPLAATALLPLAVAPLLGIAEIEDVARSFGHPLIVLFLGGFLLAKAIEKSGLHRRLAFALLGYAGKQPDRVLAAVMTTTAFLSLWISNTASAMVIAPIATAIAASQTDRPNFGKALMLGVAFSATIGGMGSLIGTPPNAIFAAYVHDAYAVQIGFAQWAAVGMPIASILLFLTWVVLARLTPGFETRELTTEFGGRQDSLGSSERRVALIACLTAIAWISRPLLEWLLPNSGLTDPGIAMIAALSLFILPGEKGERLLDWDTAATLRWDVLILFGGGLALAGIMETSGLAAWIGAQIEYLDHLPALLLAFVIAALIVYVGELASNTAMAAIFLPIAGAAAVMLEIEPVIFMLPVAFASSIGFMLPVATPPNAIVYGSGAIERRDMLLAGAPLDLVGIIVAVGMSSILGVFFFS
jgi:sodium-dependent dicarboxylate transporter 2/3/5